MRNLIRAYVRSALRTARVFSDRGGSPKPAGQDLQMGHPDWGSRRANNAYGPWKEDLELRPGRENQ